MLGLLYALLVASTGAYAAPPVGPMLAEVPERARKKQAQIADEKEKSARRVALAVPHKAGRSAGRKQS